MLDLDMEEPYLWLMLARILKNRGALGRRLIEQFSDPETVFSAPMEALCCVDGVTDDVAAEIKSVRYPGDDIRDEIKKIKESGCRFIPMNHPDYPVRLKDIHDPPLYFYVKGHLDPHDSYAIALVGARRPTTYGRRVAEMLACELTAAGFTIVSGMARGIDSVAHRTALKAGGKSIGVLGCGIDIVYPGENTPLFEEMTKQGAIISEFPLGTGPEKKNFPQRNRIISGLSLGTVVVEAAERSGSLITTRFALEQGREVFAVPGDINSEMSRGTNNLIKQGAKLVTHTEDILEEFAHLLTRPLKHDIRNNSTDDKILSVDEGGVYEKITLQPKHVDQIITESGVAPQKVMQLLLGLEIKGFVEQLPGNCYVKAAL